MSSGSGSYSCGSVPTGTRLCVLTKSPPICSTISCKIVNDVTTCSGASPLSSSAVSSLFPHAAKTNSSIEIAPHFKIFPIKFHLLFNKLILKRSEEHTSELQSRFDLVCRLLLQKKY